jgi:class 3 adenylate cyclase/tetratricopeptide (TPR) repeat protein
LFTDIVGSTELGEQLDPERLQVVLARYFDVTRDVIERHGGTVEKFIGDAVVAVFGVPRLREDDALRAVRAAAEMREALEALNDEVDVPERIRARTGVHTGEVMVGGAAPGGRLATGDAMNVAARLEQSAGPDEVLISDATYRLVRDAVQVVETDPRTLKGKVDPIRVYRLEKVDPAALGFARRLSAPMVGRVHELSLLRAAFDRAVSDDACQLFTVLGVGGVGKSRLLAAFTQELDDRATVLRGRCLPYGDGITFWPVVEAIRPAAGLTGAEDAETSLAKIAATIPDDEQAGRIARNVAQVMGLSGGEAAPEETFWAIRRLLEGMARTRPLAFVVDDLQWAEPTMLELLEHIADWAVDAPILIACMARPELLDTRPGWGGGKLNATSISLEPLSDSDCGSLVANLMAIETLDPALRDRIVEAAEGLPLFAEETLAMLVEEGRVVRRGETWVAAGDLADLSIPPTTSAILATRIDRLSADERSVLQQASVIGQVFYREALAPLRGGDEPGPELSSLVRKQFVHPERSDLSGTEALAFRHLMIRDAAYDGIPKAERADLHERFADWLERTAGDRIQEHEEILGFHLERAYRYREELGMRDEHERRLAAGAAQYFANAARRATARVDLPAAASLLGRAVALLDERDPKYAELMWESGVALNRLGDTSEANRVLTETIALAASSNDSRLETRARLDWWWTQSIGFRERDLQKMPAEVLQLIPKMEAAGDDLGLTKAWQLLAESHLTDCRYEAMREPLERALAYARRAGDRLEETETLTSLLMTDRWGPTSVSDMIARCEEALRDGSGDRRIDVEVAGTRAVAQAMLGNFDAARALLVGQREVLRDLGVPYGFWGAMIGQWEVEMLAGDPVEAERVIRAASEGPPPAGWSFNPGELATTSTFAARLANSLCAQGRFAEAAEYASIAADNDPAWAADQVLWRTAAAKATARIADPVRALELVRQAVAIAETTDVINMHGDALMDLAEVLSIVGDTAEAGPVVERALSLYERKGNVVSSARARAELTEIKDQTRRRS